MPKRRQPKNQSTIDCKFPADKRTQKGPAENPVYFCRACGRTAASDENLCQSEPMFNAW